ncbi:MAG: type II toxin-antitoxin system HicA family toxin [Desulfurococcales archaeon]|nr:type II toxin-antitoxin system HicA family toxin [Desulfurococcales archaeon]
MRRRLPRLSGREVVELLTRKFGFTVRRQRGSHVVLVKHADDRKIVTVVPLHPELKPGTLLGVLELAGITREEFLRTYEEDC